MQNLFEDRNHNRTIKSNFQIMMINSNCWQTHNHRCALLPSANIDYHCCDCVHALASSCNLFTIQLTKRLVCATIERECEQLEAIELNCHLCNLIIGSKIMNTHSRNYFLFCVSYYFVLSAFFYVNKRSEVKSRQMRMFTLFKY